MSVDLELVLSPQIVGSACSCQDSVWNCHLEALRSPALIQQLHPLIMRQFHRSNVCITKYYCTVCAWIEWQWSHMASTCLERKTHRTSDNIVHRRRICNSLLPCAMRPIQVNSLLSLASDMRVLCGLFIFTAHAYSGHTVLERWDGTARAVVNCTV